MGNPVCGTGALFSMMMYLPTTDVRHVFYACAVSRLACFNVTAETLSAGSDTMKN